MPGSHGSAAELEHTQENLPSHETWLFSDLLLRLFSLSPPYRSLSLRILLFVLPEATTIRHRKGKVQKGTDRKEMV